MVQAHNEAQEKKIVTEELAVNRASKDEQIRSRKEVVEADLAQAKPALLGTQASLNSIRKAQLDEIRALARPPEKYCLSLTLLPFEIGLIVEGLSRINKYNKGHSDFPITAELISHFVPK
ncbi:unnamed protein product [Peronospora farinosa]|uniref:Dynein heavy chain coiled coil stalk domain-containing protein n=1 Tax=Peronospora farinosa TaxID=134698 RepID=A0AAV0SRP2_9STRA|nr:unnamed protein product [Peronospora farinosa]CAI5706668.1 unnamed protein product [Peronospora farinosa]